MYDRYQIDERESIVDPPTSNQMHIIIISFTKLWSNNSAAQTMVWIVRHNRSEDISYCNLSNIHVKLNRLVDI